MNKNRHLIVSIILSLVILIVGTAGYMLFNPSFETAIRPNDTVIAIGEMENLQQLETILAPPGA